MGHVSGPAQVLATRAHTSVGRPASSAWVGMGLAAAALETPPSVISLRLRPTSGTALETSIIFNEQRQRPRLQLSARSKPVGADVWTQRDMGEGGKQWSGLNVSAERKKTRCAECTRPIPEGRASLLCERCERPSTQPANGNAGKPAEATANATTASVAGKECANAISPLRERVEDTLHLVGVGLAVALCVGIGCAALALRLSSRVGLGSGRRSK